MSVEDGTCCDGCQSDPMRAVKAIVGKAVPVRRRSMAGFNNWRPVESLAWHCEDWLAIRSSWCEREIRFASIHERRLVRKRGFRRVSSDACSTVPSRVVIVRNFQCFDPVSCRRLLPSDRELVSFWLANLAGPEAVKHYGVYGTDRTMSLTT